MSALRSIAAEIRALDTSRRALRSFGLVVGGVFVGIAAVIAWRSGAVGPWALGLGVPGAILVLLGLAVPAVLRPVYVVWMGIAVVLGFVMTRVLLTVVFVLLVVPIGLALRVAGKDLLRLRLDAGADSYWLARDDAEPVAERMTKLY